jgi:hypothetical protein
MYRLALHHPRLVLVALAAIVLLVLFVMYEFPPTYVGALLNHR